MGLPELGTELRAQGWDLALEVVREGLRDDAIPSLARLGPLPQLGDVPTFIAELGSELARPDAGRLRAGGALADVVRDHARRREALGFAPREVVTELLLLRRVVSRFVAGRAAELAPADVAEAGLLLNEAIDGLVAECVAAFFDRATAELAALARRDPLTGLLNHLAFSDRLENELERARRYGHGVTLVFVDLDRFKQVNDTLGHVEGDRVLGHFGSATLSVLRGSDVAGRLGGDEFGVLLLETGRHAASRFLRRLRSTLAKLEEAGDLPAGFTFSAGSANYPAEAADAEALRRLADERQYEHKRAGR